MPKKQAPQRPPAEPARVNIFKKLIASHTREPDPFAEFDLKDGATSIPDILSPETVDLTNRNYVVVDDVYHAYLYITGYGYSTVVGNGWLSSLVEAGEGVGLNFIIKRQPREKILAKIAQTTMTAFRCCLKKA